MTRRLLLLLGAFWLLAAPALAGEPRLEEVLAGLKAKAQATGTIRSRFVQEKRLAMLARPLVSEGLFFFRRPDALRWEYTAPVRSYLVMHAGRSRRYSELSGQTVSAEAGADPLAAMMAAQLLAWATFDLARLEGQYAMALESADPVVLRLDPKGASNGFIDHLRVAFTPDASSVASIELFEPGGDLTRLTFHDTVLNGELPPDLF